MDSLFLSNLTSPPLLFFFLGVLAVLVRSDLHVPASVAKFLSLYLLMAIGFKGGVAIAESDINQQIIIDLLTATTMAAILPVAIYSLTRRFFSAADAAAIAATYGSISAVTFVTATSYLDIQGIAWSGHLVAAMALMESPAIIVGLLLYNLQRSGNKLSWSSLAKEAIFNGSVLLILGSLAIGWISGAEGMTKVKPFVSDLFIGVLCLFLLDMGIVAAQRLLDLKGTVLPGSQRYLPLKMTFCALTATLFNAAVALLFVSLIGMPEGDALLLIILGASASYIAVPAAMRLALPEANPSIYLTMSLAITFPFNLLIGIPLYHQLIRTLLN